MKNNKKTITVTNGWRVNLVVGEEIIALRDVYAIKKGQVLKYKGGLQDESNWVLVLEGGEPFTLPEETPQEVGSHRLNVDIVVNSFEKVL